MAEAVEPEDVRVVAEPDPLDRGEQVPSGQAQDHDEDHRDDQEQHHADQAGRQERERGADPAALVGVGRHRRRFMFPDNRSGGSSNAHRASHSRANVPV
jgi:hypothetical protein